MRIAIIGSRGIPCRYGGFETFAERLSVELVNRGYKVMVYGVLDSKEDEKYRLYKGVECYNLKSPKKKILQKPVLALKSVIHCLGKKADVVLLLGVSAAPFSFLCRLTGMKTVINLDGLEWKRAKWGRLGRWYLRLSEWIATKTCNAVVADSMALVDIYKKLYRIESVYIPYGADVYDSVPDNELEKYGLKPGGYILQSCRLEPENNVHLVIEGYLKSRQALPLVILGDAPHGSRYKERLLNMSGGKVRFLGAIYGPAYRQIVAHAGLYIHAHEVGGTNPSLLEAMAVGQVPLYLDIPFNREVAGEVGFPFEKNPDALARLIDQLTTPETFTSQVHLSHNEINEINQIAMQIIKERYSWHSVISSYEKLLIRVKGEK